MLTKAQNKQQATTFIRRHWASTHKAKFQAQSQVSRKEATTVVRCQSIKLRKQRGRLRPESSVSDTNILSK